ncbi:Putative preQ0 transporter [Fulvivirga imtechensis AK7]|uniref:Probable queuosine precursor transporter n=1 Tax=Fulvivirga imtechensis AK7 TaxID=1237149 RepID=L8K009_9BACT|nr:queuosine precursor transporter [Fulvivirga imtechensis]ELR73259.1 Putative preQ0 transporter [Fulvivirga imtechensis AK7]
MKHTIDKKTNLFIILSGIFLTNALLAELVGIKIFSLESSLGFPPAQIKLLDDWVLDFNLTAGVMLWPVVFVTTDIINEYFGKEGVKKISYLTVIFISYAFLIITVVSWLEPASFWLDINKTDDAGNAFDMDYAFDKVFLQGARIIVGSLVAFLIGQLLDVFVFHKLRHITGSKMLWLRATGSTLVSQLIDSFVVLFIAFYLLASADAKWSLAQVLSVGIINYIYKFAVAIIMTPTLYIAHYLIDRYLGKDKAEKMMEDAAAKSTSFF